MSEGCDFNCDKCKGCPVPEKSSNDKQCPHCDSYYDKNLKECPSCGYSKG